MLPGIVAKMKDGTGHTDTRTIQKVCELLKCQPGQIMEYIPAAPKDEKEEDTAPAPADSDEELPAFFQE